MTRASTLAVFLAAWLVPLSCAALTQIVPPVMRASDDPNLLQRLSATAAQVLVQVRGRGEILRLHYQSDGPAEVVVFLTPVLDINSALTARLPQGEAEARIDLTRSHAWTPLGGEYRIFVLGEGESVSVASSPPLERLRFWRLPGIALRHLFTSEPYQPSSYHRLRGSAVFGVPVAPLAGVALLLLAAVIAAFAPSSRGLFLRSLLVAAALLAASRVTLDFGRFTTAHLAEWYREGTYEEAGAAHAIARAVAAMPDAESGSVFLCHDGTSYFPTILRYALYPIPLTLAPMPETTHAVLRGEVGGSEEGGVLRCGEATLRVTAFRAFPDGSRLYRVQRP